MKTYSPKPEHIDRRWYVMDASGQILGRLATEVATVLRGKHKPMFAPHMDTGDHVIVVNADKVELSGNKLENKIAYRHSGHPGGIRGVRYAELLANRPVQAVEKAVRGMLPKNRLGRQMIGKLHVVAGPEHPHAAQKPVALGVGERPIWEGLPARPTAKPGPKPTRAPKESEGADASTAPPKKRTTARKPAARKPAAAKKPAAKKPAASTKSTAKKPTAKRSAAKTTTTKKTTAKRTTTKKSEE
jgi:large subunit ribosomal protein L13